MDIKKESPTFVGTLSLRNENCTTDLSEIQEKFVPRLDNTFQLADRFQRLGLFEQAELVRNCGNFLLFRRGITDQGELAERSQLHKANFCKNRLCPMCAWRRGLKMYSQAIQIANALEQDYNAIFLTLTIPNIVGADVSAQLCKMQNAWHKLVNLRPIKKAMCGYIKTLEITYNKNSDTFHPHYHVVIFVSKDYGTNGYISHGEWLQYWRNCMQDQSINFVNVKKIYANDRKGTDGFAAAIAEVCKYPFKPTALEHDNAVLVLSQALYGVRTISMGGIAKEIANRLKLDDIEQGDLVQTDIDQLENYNAYVMSYYGRAYGSKQYELFKQIIEVNNYEQ